MYTLYIRVYVSLVTTVVHFWRIDKVARYSHVPYPAGMQPCPLPE